MENSNEIKKSIKPNKEIYNNQEDIISLVLEKLRTDLPLNCEAYIFGSLAEKKFGKYSEIYKGHKGSDIDVIVFCNSNLIPSHWKYLNVSKGWWDLYRGLKIEINGLLHKTDILLVKKSFEEIARNRILELGWKTIKVF